MANRVKETSLIRVFLKALVGSMEDDIEDDKEVEEELKEIEKIQNSEEIKKLENMLNVETKSKMKLKSEQTAKNISNEEVVRKQNFQSEKSNEIDLERD